MAWFLFAVWFQVLRFRFFLFLGYLWRRWVFANIRTPLSIGILAAIAVITYFAGKWAAKTSFKYAALVCTVGYVALFVALRIMADHVAGFAFPLGGAIWLLSGASYVIDIARKHSAPARIDDELLYITFFPVMVAGPVIKYKDFEKYTEREHGKNHRHIHRALEMAADGR